MKQIVVRIIFYLLLLNIPHLAISQQFGADDVKKQMIADWSRAKDFTLQYLHAMPASKYEFKPVDSVMSFASQMIHLAVTNSFLVFMTSDKTPPEFTWADIDSRPNSHSKDSVLHYVSASYDYCINTIKILAHNNWRETKEISKQIKTRYELLLNAFEHQTHHRGQITIYLRLQGIVPPEANLF